MTPPRTLAICLAARLDLLKEVSRLNNELKATDPATARAEMLHDEKAETELLADRLNCYIIERNTPASK